jgi:hypothetical protein
MGGGYKFNMKNNLRLIIISAIMLVIIMIVPVFATTTDYINQSFIAEFPVLEDGYTIFIDDDVVVTEDFIGNTIQPFYVEGVMYLPVDTVVHAMGKNIIEWNDSYLMTETYRYDDGSANVNNEFIDQSNQNNIINTYDSTEDPYNYILENLNILNWIGAPELLVLIENGSNVSDLVNQEYVDACMGIVVHWYGEILRPHQTIISVMIALLIIFGIGKFVIDTIAQTRNDKKDAELKESTNEYILNLEKQIKELKVFAELDQSAINKYKTEIESLNNQLNMYKFKMK